jgi:hypothetical protein
MEHEGQNDLKSTIWIKGEKRDRKKVPVKAKFKKKSHRGHGCL